MNNLEEILAQLLLALALVSIPLRVGSQETQYTREVCAAYSEQYGVANYPDASQRYQQRYFVD